ncbi:MAG TPA: DUF1269 domain-containing protein [Chloroflexota bacterium]|nr:DUF1269 domain-containing protein [Chloroflexota bacterium]
MSGIQEIAPGARVAGTDGALGRLTTVVVDPVRRRLTHIVVEGDGVGPNAVMVPVQHIAAATRESVRLDCSKADVSEMREFYATRYVSPESPEAQPVIRAWESNVDLAFSSGYPMYYQPYVLPGGDVPVTDERVPPGETAFFRGSRVQSSDGKDVGSVEEFIVSSRDDAITHFVVRMGHLLTAREVALPLSTVASTAEGDVFLKLTQAEVERLPAVPVRRHYEWTSSSPGTMELVSFVFATPGGAEQALTVVQERVAANHLPRLDAAVLSKDASGKLRSRQPHDVSAGRGALVGAVVGGLLTLVAGPLGPIAGAAAGGAIGGLGAGAVDRGVPDRYLGDLGRTLQPGTSALVALVHPAAVNALVEDLQPLGGSVLRQLLTDEMISGLTAPSGSEPAAAGETPGETPGRPGGA